MNRAETVWVEIDECMKVRSRIEATALLVPDDLDDLQELMAAMRAQELRYREAPKHEVMAAIRRGELKHTRLLGRQGGQNKLIRGFYRDFFARLAGNSTPPGVNQTLYIMKFALGTSYAPTSFAQNQLGNEIYRATPDEFYDDTISTFYATTYLKKTQANVAVTAVDSSDETTITLDSATGITSGGRFQVETANATYTFTGTLSGLDLTATAINGNGLSNAGEFPASDIPQPGDVVQALHSEACCFIGADTDDTVNSGTPMNRKLLEQPKPETANLRISLLYDYILACESLD